MKKNFINRIITFALVVILAISAPAVVFAEPEDSEPVASGFLTDWVLTQILDTTVEWTKNLILEGLGAAGDTIDDGWLRALNNFMDYAGGTADTSKILQLCEQIEKDIKKVDADIKIMEDAIEASVHDLKKYEVTQTYVESENVINRKYKDYHDIIENYSEYAAAVGDYAQAKTTFIHNPNQTNKDKMVKAKSISEKKQKVFYESLPDQKQITSDINDVAQKTCTYYPSKKANEKTKDKATERTHMTKAYDVCKEGYAFDHQTYEFMYNSMNDCTKTFMVIAQVARYKYDYEDATDSKNIDLESDKCEENLNRCLNAVNDVCSQYDLNVYMRPYDIETSKKMKFSYKGSYEYRVKGDFEPLNDYSYETIRRNSQETMNFYRVKIGNDVFLIQKNNNYDVADMTYSYSQVLPTVQLFDRVNMYMRSQDWFNSLETADGVYSLIKDESLVKKIVKTNAYIDYSPKFSEFFVNQGLTDIPRIGANDFVAVNQFLPPDASINVNHNLWETGLWLKGEISRDYINDAKVDQKLDDENYSKMMFIYSANKNEKNSVKTHSLDREEYGTVTVTDPSGSAITGTYPAGAKMNIKITEKPYGMLESLVIKSQSTGKVLAEIANKGSFDVVKDKDGSRTYIFPMPYQDCVVESSFVKGNRGGTGTAEDPYVIGNIKDFDFYVSKALTQDMKNAHFQLEGDIIIPEGYGSNPDKNSFLCRGEFSGVFDGNGHRILNSNGNLFDTITTDGTVLDTKFVFDSTVTSQRPFIAYENKGTIDGIEMHSLISDQSNNNEIHGVISEKNSGIIRNSSSNLYCNAFNSYYLVNDNSGGRITNSFTIKNDIDYSKKGIPVAGIANKCDSKSQIINCYTNTNALVAGTKDPAKNSERSYYQYDGKTKSWGTALDPKDMNDSDVLLDMLNKYATNNMKHWLRNPDINNGYPYLSEKVNLHILNISKTGNGEVELFNASGNNAVKAQPGSEITIKTTAESGNKLISLSVMDKKSNAIQSFKLGRNDPNELTNVFIMPDSDVIVKAVFTGA